jgi:hypothetical protein
MMLLPWQQSFAQEPDALTARALYYNPGSEDHPKPKKQVSSRDTQQASKSAPAFEKAPDNSLPGATATSVSTHSMMPVPHLGVKYNLVLVDDKGDEQPADPDKDFHQGDCLSLRVQSNYDGYLYVLQRGSTGKWDVLLPSTLMSDETNVIRANTTTKIPANYCFAVDSSRGVEHVFVVLSRNAEDVNALNSAVRALHPSNANGSGSQPTPALTQEMASLRDRLQARDLSIRKISKPVEAGESPNTVYVINTTRTPSDRIVTEIPLRHE